MRPRPGASHVPTTESNHVGDSRQLLGTQLGGSLERAGELGPCLRLEVEQDFAKAAAYGLDELLAAAKAAPSHSPLGAMRMRLQARSRSDTSCRSPRADATREHEHGRKTSPA